jgi:hypothetical protein
VKMQGIRGAGAAEVEALALPLFSIRIETEVLDPDRPSLHTLLDRLSKP